MVSWNGSFWCGIIFIRPAVRSIAGRRFGLAPTSYRVTWLCGWHATDTIVVFVTIVAVVVVVIVLFLSLRWTPLGLWDGSLIMAFRFPPCVVPLAKSWPSSNVISSLAIHAISAAESGILDGKSPDSKHPTQRRTMISLASFWVFTEANLIIDYRRTLFPAINWQINSFQFQHGMWGVSCKFFNFVPEGLPLLSAVLWNRNFTFYYYASSNRLWETFERK